MARPRRAGPIHKLHLDVDQDVFDKLKELAGVSGRTMTKTLEALIRAAHAAAVAASRSTPRR